MSEATGIRAALLIDADNFHEVVQLRAAYEQFVQRTAKGVICHVHGADRVLHNESLKPVWLEMAARLFPCLPLRKNTTDAALICDALVLHFHHGVTRFGICSGDADFAPLALQLRELGCEVVCFARMSIAFSDMTRFYDKVVRFDLIPAPSATQTLPGTIVQVTGLPVSAPKPDIKEEAQQKTKPPLAKLQSKNGKSEATGAKKSKPSSPDDTQAVKKILAELPGWSPHTVRQLNQIGAPLRAAGLNPSSKPLHHLFRRYPYYFTVLPDDKPRRVRLEHRP